MKPFIKLFIILLLGLALHITLYTLHSYAAVPHLINYQGRLTDASGKPLSDGAHAITFRIFDAETAGNLLWQGTYSVTTQKGIFNVLLGDISDAGYNFSNLAFDKSYFLEIKVETEVMSPRQRITSAGYAVRAEEAEKLGGKLPADYALAADITSMPTANKAVRMDNNAKLPVAALKTYDSGWFAVSANNTYVKTHNLGTTKVIYYVFFNNTASDSNMMTCSMPWTPASVGGIGYQFQSITPTSITIRTGSYAVSQEFISTGAWYDRASGYYRIIGLALE